MAYDQPSLDFATASYVTLAGAGLTRRRHLPGLEGGTLCHPEAPVEPAGPEFAASSMCKTCVAAERALRRARRRRR